MSLSFEDVGSGDVVVFLHAGIADRRMWAAQVPAFAKHFRVITHDMRGYGDSPLPTERYSPRADLAGLLDRLGIDRAFVVGCSMGGATALEFSIEYPQRTAGLVLVNSGAPGFVPEGGYYDPPEWKDLVAAFEAGDFTRAAEIEVAMWVVGPFRDAGAVPAEIRDAVRDMDIVALRNESQRDDLIDRPEPPAGLRLDEVGCPALVVVSELDMPDMLPLGEHLAAGIAGARLARIDGAAHLPNMERPEAFNEIVLEFLLSLKG